MMEDETTPKTFDAHTKNISGERSKKRSKIKILINFLQDIRLTFSLIKDYWNGDYRDVSVLTVVSIVVAFLYMVSPIDLVTDMIPVIGWIDDIVIIVLCLKLLHGDLEKYKKFKAEARAAGHKDHTRLFGN